MGSRLRGNDGRTHIVIPATAGGRRMGSRLHENDGRRTHNRRRESMAGGGRGWVPVSTGTTGGGSQVISE